MWNACHISAGATKGQQGQQVIGPTKRQATGAERAGFLTTVCAVAPRTQAVYYRDPEGGEPVADFLDALEVEVQATLDLQIDRLNGLPANAPPLPFPHTSQVDGPLRELRCHYGSSLYRVLYRRSDNLFVLLHMMRKNSGKIPEQDIVVAKQRWEDFEERMNAEPRTPPRAAGHDAP
jgi:phage-related protein